jgi:LemA protein
MESFKLSKPAIATAIILGIVVVMASWIGANYNSLVTSKVEVEKSWGKVETSYQRRFDLVGNLVEGVKGSQKQEIQVFTAIADARKQYSQASTPNEKAEAATTIETNLSVVPRLQEAYPELKSNAQVQSLMTELTGTEDGIKQARDTYNDIASDYNKDILRLPKKMFAGMFGFTKQSLFKSGAGADQAVKVQF